MSGSMSGMWKRGTVWIMRHRQTKGPDTDRPDLNNRATSRLYSLLGVATRNGFLGGHLSEMPTNRPSGFPDIGAFVGTNPKDEPITSGLPGIRPLESAH